MQLLDEIYVRRNRMDSSNHTRSIEKKIEKEKKKLSPTSIQLVLEKFAYFLF